MQRREGSYRRGETLSFKGSADSHNACDEHQEKVGFSTKESEQAICLPQAGCQEGSGKGIPKMLAPGGTSSKEPTCQCRRHEAQVRSLGQEGPLEKVMATHSSIPAWRIPWTEEPGGLQSMWSQRVRHY